MWSLNSRYGNGLFVLAQGVNLAALPCSKGCRPQGPMGPLGAPRGPKYLTLAGCLQPYILASIQPLARQVLLQSYCKHFIFRCFHFRGALCHASSVEYKHAKIQLGRRAILGKPLCQIHHLENSSPATRIPHPPANLLTRQNIFNLHAGARDF